MTAASENQRRADLGNGTYVNPVLAGDHPDPTVLRDGDDYYMTFSSFEAYPGLVIWHSRDLVNWTPIGPAITAPIGSVFAVDLCKHGDRYFIYIPVIPTTLAPSPGGPPLTYVIWADDIRGPWSEPIDLGIRGTIDPGHVVGEDGHRYLFMSGVTRIRLADDGLSTAGELETVYDGWRYPDDWIVEAYALEGPKLLRRGDWFYLISAVGGTGGPPTGHMVIVARSRSVHGPWENDPQNPIIRTVEPSEAWWSRGHATLVEGPDGRWRAVYHGYENGFRTLGRQLLVEPIEWTDDGWPRALGRDLSGPLPMPAESAGRHGFALSDDFSQDSLGLRWAFYQPSASEADRATFGNGLRLTAKGDDPLSSSPLTVVVGDRAYEVQVDLELDGDAQGGLLLFFDRRLFSGLGVDSERMLTYRNGIASHWREAAPAVRRWQLRITNDHHIVTMHYRAGDGDWVRHGLRMETSGHHANSSADLASLRPALFACGDGSVTFRNFRYRAL
ncbi:family 43 glycosylhydrolase [Lysobacter korlensis]|uniref:Family 43 glycosylhydrolase n=1 Tax=Lysobacter korlensis TaxID=553636 RepID=A0ABV6RX47_9GAMM